MNKQINPDHCYETEDGVLYIEHPESDKPRVIVAGNVSDDFKAKLAAALNNRSVK